MPTKSMIKIAYAFLVFWTLVGCNSSPKKDVNTNTTTQSESKLSKSDDNGEVAEMTVNTPKEDALTIEKLKAAFKANDEVAFLEQFPKYFHQFSNYFGWNEVADEPNPLYDVSIEYIDYWFHLLDNPKNKFLEEKLIELCMDGGWQADGVNYFQDKTLAYFKENNKYYLINNLSDEKAFSVLFFLFDGPHPKMDHDFATHLNDSKKELLVELFEDGPFTVDTPEDDFQKNLSFYTSNDSYFIKEIDVNNDAILDKVVSSKPYEGDDLLVFISTGDTYEFALKAINF